MRNPFRLLAGFAMAALLGLSLIAPAAAQDADTETLGLEEIDGMQRLVARYYSVDLEAMLDSMGTPGAGGEDALDLWSAQFASAGVFQFESDETAESGFDVLYEELRTGLVEPGDTPELQIEEYEVDDLGDEARALDTVVDEEGRPLHLTALFVRDGQHIFYLIGSSAREEGAQTVLVLARSMVDAEPGDGEESFAEDGTSTGGIWDLLPAAGHEALGEMIPQADEILFPEDGETTEDES